MLLLLLFGLKSVKPYMLNIALTLKNIKGIRFSYKQTLRSSQVTSAVSHVTFFMKHVLDRKNSIQKIGKEHVRTGKQ